MKKEFIACLTLLILFIGSAINILYLAQIINTMTTHIETAEQNCISNNYTAAQEELSSALNLWIDIDEYSHVFIRHSEIDAATDAFYEALSAIQQKDPSAVSMLKMTQYHIESILSMERITLKSVF